MTTKSSTDCPIPLKSIAELERGLGRSLKGWAAKRPLYVSPAPEIPGAWFDVDAVVRVVKALRKMPHTKGRRWQRRPFEPETWQIVWLIAPVFGWKHADGTRIVRELWDEIPRKNGKSSLAARLALVLAAADGEWGGEVYAAATSTDQARAVFDQAKMVAERSASLRRRCEPLASVIRFPRTGTIFRVLSKMADVAHGLNVSGAVIDEIHLHKKRELIDAITTGVGARDQPLVVFITTAGDDDETTIYAEKHNAAVKIGKGEVVDHRVWVAIWCAEKDDDPFDPATWAKANPNYPITPSHEWLEGEFAKAKESPTLLRTLLRLTLNIRSGSAAERWKGADFWIQTGNVGIVAEDKLKGKATYGGLMAASASDLAALTWMFDNPEGVGVWSLWRYFLPEEQLADLNRRTNGSAEIWSKPGGPLTITPGNQIDLDAIVERVKADARIFDVREFGYFAGGALGIVQPLMDADIAPMVTIYSNTPGSSLVDWERMLRAGEFNHGGNPISSWQVAHVAVRETGGGIWRFDNKLSAENVYGIIAAEIALRRFLVKGDDEPGTLETYY